MCSCPPEGPPPLNAPVRVLCLGNDILGDDALGPAVAAEVSAHPSPDVEVVATELAGFGLLDDLLNTSRLLVVDTVRTGTAAPGTIYLVREEDLRGAPGTSPHYVGIFEMLALARTLRLPVPEDVVILAVEASDGTTVGGPMHPAVRAAVPLVTRQIEEILGEWRQPQAA